MSYYTLYKIGVYVSTFSCQILIDPCRFRNKGVSQSVDHSCEAENVVTPCFAHQTGRASGYLPVIDWFVPFSHFKLHLYACHPEMPLHEKTAQINQLKAGKYCNFLFGKQNRKKRHFGLHHSVPHPIKSPSCEKVHGSITLMAGKCWHFLFGLFWRLEVLPFSPSALKKGSHRHIDTNFCGV